MMATLTVFGATSFVGEIITTNLANRNEEYPGLQLVIAGRSQQKLNKLKQSLNSSIEIVIADSNDYDSLLAMCHSTDVVLSTVGPYSAYGEKLIQACVETGTDYCDLAGEPLWLRLMIDKYHTQAVKTGARIINCVGYDCLPSDMGVYFLQQAALEKFSQTCSTIKMRVTDIEGGISGGTALSKMTTAEDNANAPAKYINELENHYLLCPSDHQMKENHNKPVFPLFEKDFNGWSSSSMMTFPNTQLVYRTNALNDYPYGTSFQYNEGMTFGNGLLKRVKASAIEFALHAMDYILDTPFTRNISAKLLPKSGDGPSLKNQDKGYWEHQLVGTTKDGKTISAKIKGLGDPGYKSTGKLVEQTLLSLLFDVDKDKAPGFSTTATIFDQQLIERLNKYSDVSFELVD